MVSLSHSCGLTSWLNSRRHLNLFRFRSLNIYLTHIIYCIIWHLMVTNSSSKHIINLIFFFLNSSFLGFDCLFHSLNSFVLRYLDRFFINILSTHWTRGGLILALRMGDPLLSTVLMENVTGVASKDADFAWSNEVDQADWAAYFFFETDWFEQVFSKSVLGTTKVSLFNWFSHTLSLCIGAIHCIRVTIISCILNCLLMLKSNVSENLTSPHFN